METRLDVLIRWERGDPPLPGHKPGLDCYPDFSCCFAHLKAPDEVRADFKRLWLANDGEKADEMLGVFLVRAMPWLNREQQEYERGR